MSSTFDFAQGDPAYHSFRMPASNWTSGGRLFFTAKQNFDDIADDSSAAIKGDWGDDAVSDVIINGVLWKRYACDFPEGTGNNILSNGQAKLNLKGEFQFVSATGQSSTFPAANVKKIPCILYFDITNRTTA